MTDELDYLSHLATESARFVEVLRDAPADASVPTCPDWTADDLLWHLGEVQWFWGTIVREGRTDPDGLEDPDRPSGNGEGTDDRRALVDFFEKSSAGLQDALATTPREAVRWTWSDEQSAGFIRRRQAHEALIHRLDAELTADVERTPMDPVLCTDGVDESLRIMYAGCPDWGHVEPEPGTTIRIRATDTRRSWLVTMARFTGTDPEGKTHDESDIVVADVDPGEPTAATVEGTAADLDCWLWNRPTAGALDRSGDTEILTRFQEILDRGID